MILPVEMTEEQNIVSCGNALESGVVEQCIGELTFFW
jgi:hypothetical protein